MVRIGEQYLLGLKHYEDTHMLISFIPPKNKITVNHDSVLSVALADAMFTNRGLFPQVS